MEEIKLSNYKAIEDYGNYVIVSEMAKDLPEEIWKSSVESMGKGVADALKLAGLELIDDSVKVYVRPDSYLGWATIGMRARGTLPAKTKSLFLNLISKYRYYKTAYQHSEKQYWELYSKIFDLLRKYKTTNKVYEELDKWTERR